MTYVIAAYELDQTIYFVEAWADGELMTARKRVFEGTKAACLSYLASVL